MPLYQTPRMKRVGLRVIILSGPLNCGVLYHPSTTKDVPVGIIRFDPNQQTEAGADDYQSAL